MADKPIGDNASLCRFADNAQQLRQKTLSTDHQLDLQKDMLPFNNRELGNLQKHLSLTPNQNQLSKRHLTWNEGWVSCKFMKGQRHKEN